MLITTDLFKQLFISPAGVDCDDFILRVAFEQDALVLSNDLYRDHIARGAVTREWVRERRVSFMFVNGQLLVLGETPSATIVPPWAAPAPRHAAPPRAERLSQPVVPRPAPIHPDAAPSGSPIADGSRFVLDDKAKVDELRARFPERLLPLCGANGGSTLVAHDRLTCTNHGPPPSLPSSAPSSQVAASRCAPGKRPADPAPWTEADGKTQQAKQARLAASKAPRLRESASQQPKRSASALLRAAPVRSGSQVFPTAKACKRLRVSVPTAISPRKPAAVYAFASRRPTSTAAFKYSPGERRTGPSMKELLARRNSDGAASSSPAATDNLRQRPATLSPIGTRAVRRARTSSGLVKPQPGPERALQES